MAPLFGPPLAETATNPERPARAWVRRFALPALFALGLAALTSGCDSSGCRDGEYCECTQLHGQCYLDCAGDGCAQACHDVDECGAVCDDGCIFDCHNTQRCSDYCGDNCSMRCNDTSACATICGRGCDYSCRSVADCSARVGDGSQVRCQDATSCNVECEGDCRVTCVQVGGGGCNVTCRGAGRATECGPGVFACGPC